MKNILFFAVAVVVGFAFSSTKTKTNDHTHVHAEGKYDSKKGVMHNISCYGVNIGYLTNAAGEKTVVCFDRMENGNDLNVSCEHIKVEGYYEEIIKEADGGSCVSGKLNVLFVETWSCL